MNIFFREMKAHRKSLIIWCVGMVLLIAASMVKFTTMSAAGQSMKDIIEQLPKSVQVILSLESFDLMKASGFYGMLFFYLALMATIHASMLGADIISKEEQDKTSEFLFTKPVSRNRIITAKLSAAFVNIIIFNLVTYISSLGIVGKYSNGESVTDTISKLMIGMFLLQLIFMFIGTGIAAVSKRPRTAASASTGILLASFVICKAIDLNERLDFLKYITPFKYYDAKNLLLGPGFEPVFIALTVMIIAFLFSVTYIFFGEKDLRI